MINYVKDIMNQDYSFKTIAQMRSQYIGIDILEYISLVQTIPPVWKRWIRDDTDMDCVPPRIDLIDKYSSIVSIAYKCLNANNFEIVDKIDRWQQKLQTPVFLEEFLKYCKRIWSITNYTKLRSFQYRLLMNAIITNVHLFKWKIDNITPYCTFCMEFLETDIHLFCQCIHVKNIWNLVFKWLAKIQGTPVCQLSTAQILFNTAHPSPKHVNNVLVLIVKFNIYRSRCLKTKPSIFSIREDIVHFQKMELLGAIVKNKVYQCKNKWNNVLEAIQ